MPWKKLADCDSTFSTARAAPQSRDLLLLGHRREVAAELTFKHGADRYLRDELLKKAPATRKDNLRELANLLEFFENASAGGEPTNPRAIGIVRPDPLMRSAEEVLTC